MAPENEAARPLLIGMPAKFRWEISPLEELVINPQEVINNFTAAHMPQDATKYRVIKAFFFARNAWAPYAPACIYWEVQFYAAKGTDNATGL